MRACLCVRAHARARLCSRWESQSLICSSVQGVCVKPHLITTKLALPYRACLGIFSLLTINNPLPDVSHGFFALLVFSPLCEAFLLLPHCRNRYCKSILRTYTLYRAFSDPSITPPLCSLLSLPASVSDVQHQDSK